MTPEARARAKLIERWAAIAIGGCLLLIVLVALVGNL